MRDSEAIQILGVGVATLDIIDNLADYPTEDTEQRALARSSRLGGNAANTLVVLSQLGQRCAWAGTLADDVSSAQITEDLATYHIDTTAVQVIAGGHAPTSYVTLNQQNGSRTIVHYRDLEEYPAAALQGIDLAGFDWLHFEGRNVAQTRLMLEDAWHRAPQVPRSVEVEKPRDGIDSLFGLADLLLYSRGYAEHCGFAAESGGAEAFLGERHRACPDADHVCSWGAQGAYAVERQGRILHAPAVAPLRVVDTLAAGDTFNAGIIDARLRGLDLQAALNAACALAGRKCGQPGLAGLVNPALVTNTQS